MDESKIYDDLLKTDSYAKDITKEHVLFPVIEEVMSRIDKKDKILEIGCGTGQFAKILINKGYNYALGIDISSVAVSLSHLRCGKADMYFRQCDAAKQDYNGYDVVIGVEVLEHMAHDLAVLQKIESGTKVVFSVPNYMSKMHVRCFANKEKIWKRYGHLIKDMEIEEIVIKNTAKIFVFGGTK